MPLSTAQSLRWRLARTMMTIKKKWQESFLMSAIVENSINEQWEWHIVSSGYPMFYVLLPAPGTRARCMLHQSSGSRLAANTSSCE